MRSAILQKIIEKKKIAKDIRESLKAEKRELLKVKVNSGKTQFKQNTTKVKITQKVKSKQDSIQKQKRVRKTKTNKVIIME